MRFGIKSYPFTIPGTVITLLVLYLFGTGYIRSDYQSVFIALSFFFIVMVLFSWCFYFSGKYFFNEIDFRSNGVISTSEHDKNSQMVLFEEKPPVFYRYSMIMRGRFHAAGKSFPYFRRYSSDRDGKIVFSLRIKSPGSLEVGTEYYLEDIFGFVRIKCSSGGRKSFNIAAGNPDEAYADSNDVPVSFEKNKKPDDNDYEKILMREYMRGDRSRDINWKASSKSNTMFTRISQGNDTEVKKINIIYFPDPLLFSDNLYRGFLVYRYMREYFRFYLYELFRKEGCLFNIFINGERTEVHDSKGIDLAVQNLSKPYIKGSPDADIYDETGSFIVFTESADKLSEIRHLFKKDDSVRFFYPETAVIDCEKRVSEGDNQGYYIQSRNFYYPGQGILTGAGYIFDMFRFTHGKYCEKYSHDPVSSDGNFRKIRIISPVSGTGNGRGRKA